MSILGTIENVTPNTVGLVNGGDMVVLLPRTGLFADLVPEKLYPHADRHLDREEITGRIRYALDLLRSFSPKLMCDFEAVVRTIVATPSISDQVRRSYSCRLIYFGGIFVDVLSENDPTATVESLLHEYMHLELWRLWAFHPELHVKPDGERIESPLTGRMLEKDVMAQAYLIYLESARLHSWLADVRGYNPSADRASLLMASARKLQTALMQSQAGEPSLSRLLDFGNEWLSA